MKHELVDGEAPVCSPFDLCDHMRTLRRLVDVQNDEEKRFGVPTAVGWIH